MWDGRTVIDSPVKSTLCDHTSIPVQLRPGLHQPILLLHNCLGLPEQKIYAYVTCAISLVNFISLWYSHLHLCEGGELGGAEWGGDRPVICTTPPPPDVFATNLTSASARFTTIKSGPRWAYNFLQQWDTLKVLKFRVIFTCILNQNPGPIFLVFI